MLSMRAMKWVDHWVGLPLCTLLAVFCSGGKRQPPGEPRRIAVAKFFGLGSIVLSSAMVRSLRARYPRARITFLTFAGNRRLVELTGLADEVWTVRQTALGFLADTLRLLTRLARHRPDVFIDLEFYSKYVTLLAILSGARKRVGYHLASFWRTRVYTHPVFFNHRVHITRVYAEVARLAGTEVTERQPRRVEVPQAAWERLKRLYAEQGVQGPPIAVNVNASDLAFCRRWPLEHFAAVLERLAAQRDAALVLTAIASSTRPARWTWRCCWRSTRTR